MTVQEFNEFVTQNLVCILGVFMIGAFILSWLLDRSEKMKKKEKMRDRTPSNEEVYRMIDLCIDKELQYTLNREYDKANYYKRKKEMYKDLLRITP